MVQSGVHDQFVDELTKAVRGLKQGDAFVEGVNIGPLINEPAAKKVRNKERWGCGLVRRCGLHRRRGWLAR